MSNKTLTHTTIEIAVVDPIEKVTQLISNYLPISEEKFGDMKQKLKDELKSRGMITNISLPRAMSVYLDIVQEEYKKGRINIVFTKLNEVGSN